MAVSCSRRNYKWMLLMVVLTLAIYFPLNVIYVASMSRVDRSLKRALSAAQIGLHDMALQVKDFRAQPDGKIDLLLSVDLNQLLKFAKATAVGSFDGEFTSNPLPSNTSFVLHNADACKQLPNLQYLIYVHSAPANVERRAIIRNTWASPTLYRNKMTKLLFMMGTPELQKEKDIIKAEFELHGDIVQGNFVEHYRNLTLKGIMGLQWVTKYCPNAKYVIKADDDAFVNIFELMKVVDSHKSEKNVLMCPLWKDKSMPILRDPAKCMKWCVRFNEFPGQTHFPKYCAGLSYLMSRDLVANMYKASLSTPFFWIDDVYITGLLPQKVKDVNYVDLLRNFTLKEALACEQYMSSKPVTYIFSHVKKSENFYQLWNGTLSRLPQDKVNLLSETAIKNYTHIKSTS